MVRERAVALVGLALAGLTACGRTATQRPGVAGATPSPAAAARGAPNVLLVVVDDLNQWVGCLGHPQAKTPNIDRLAARGVLFTNAHCAGPECNPSRAALLSGMRPTTTGVYRNEDDWKDHIRAGLGLTVPFQRAGYEVIGVGKIAHGSRRYGSEWDDSTGAEEDDEGKLDGLLDPAPAVAADADVPDWQVVDACIEQLGKAHARPFFLACGLRKPHLPWSVPQKYYDLFPLDRIDLPARIDGDLDDVPAAGVRLAEPQEEHRKILKRGRWRAAIQGYLAACAYTDMNVGRLLAALEQGPHAGNTVVVLLGDHGFHLGEKEHWRKAALWEEATRVPLIVVAPGVTAAGQSCAAPVDLLAVFPTLCDLAALAVPPHVEGKSLRPLLVDPAAAWDGVAITTCGYGNHAVRTARWRYIRYADGGEELYDHERDPQEWRNLAGVPEFAATRTELQARLPRDAVRPGERPWGAEKKDKKK